MEPTQVWSRGTWKLYVGSGGITDTCTAHKVLCAVPSCPQKHGTCCKISIEGQVSKAYDEAFIYLQEAEGNECDAMVCASDGCQRAPALIMAYIMRAAEMSLWSAWHVLRSRWPFPCIDRHLFKGLMELERLLYPEDEPTMELDDWEKIYRDNRG